MRPRIMLEARQSRRCPLHRYPLKISWLDFLRSSPSARPRVSRWRVRRGTRRPEWGTRRIDASGLRCGFESRGSGPFMRRSRACRGAPVYSVYFMLRHKSPPSACRRAGMPEPSRSRYPGLRPGKEAVCHRQIRLSRPCAPADIMSLAPQSLGEHARPIERQPQGRLIEPPYQQQIPFRQCSPRKYTVERLRSRSSAWRSTGTFAPRSIVDSGQGEGLTVVRAGELLMISESHMQDLPIANCRAHPERNRTGMNHDQNQLIRSLRSTPGPGPHYNRLQYAQALVAYAICAHRCKAPAPELRWHR